jgi:DNA polymerase
LLGGDLPLGRMRGKQHKLDTSPAPVVVTYHPAYLLRSPSQKRKSWQDLCLARDLLRKSSS